MLHLSLRTLLVLTLSLVALSARAEQPKRPPFDFAAAERAADQQLKRAPAPVEPKKAVEPPFKVSGPPPCPICKGLLTIVCPQHKLQAAYIAKGQAAADVCPICLGTGIALCPQCKAKKELQAQLEPAAARIKDNVAMAQAVIKEIDELEAADRLNLKLGAYVTPHFSVATTLDKKFVLPCLTHGESMLDRLNGDFHAEKFYFTLPADTRFVLLNSQAEYRRYLEKVWKDRFPDLDMELTAKGSGNHSYNLPSTAINCFEKISRNAVLLQHTFVHFLGHFLLNRLSAIRNYPAWLEEGFAAYGETTEMQAPWVYCFAYQANQMDITKNRDATLKRMAQQGKPVGMDRLTQMTFMDMKADEYFEAWSLVTMLVERDPEKFIAFLQGLPDGERDPGGLRIPAADQEKALLEAYGYDFPKLLAVWQRWVLR